jgi:hypothetical protein
MRFFSASPARGADLWAVVQHADWGAAAVFAFFAGILGETARRGWQAPDALYRQYRDDRARTKANLEADRILPEMAKLVAEVNREVSQSLGSVADGQTLSTAMSDTGILLNNLQWAGYQGRLARLARLSADYELVDRLFDAAVTWTRRVAASAAIACLALVIVGVAVSFGELRIPPTAVGMAAIFLVVSLVSLGVSGISQISVRNRLGRLFRTYE